MDVNEMSKTMTREGFLNKVKGQCPDSFGLIEFQSGNSECRKFEDCPECREHSIKDIQFKGEEDEIIEELKDNSQWIFNLEEFKNDNILIACHSKDEAEKFINILITNGINTWDDEDELISSNTYYDWCEGTICYEFDVSNGLFHSDINDYEKDEKINYKIYDFDTVDFSQVYTKESINGVALRNNKQNDFDITKVKYITKEQLSNRGYKTGDILFDGESMTIIYGNKTLHINTNCVETLNPKAFDYILPIELIESDSEIQRLLSGKLSGKISQSYLVDYFIKIEEPPKLKTVCSVKFTVNADCPKDFILEDDSEAISVNDIVEANTGGKNYQYAKVVEINTLELSEHEIVIYGTCRRIFL